MGTKKNDTKKVFIRRAPKRRPGQTSKPRGRKTGAFGGKHPR